jgi:hypothetical protein
MVIPLQEPLQGISFFQTSRSMKNIAPGKIPFTLKSFTVVILLQANPCAEEDRC